MVSFRVRLLAGLALALWPGQVFFSGVVAQDNWVLPPTVALACVATRALLAGGRGRPVRAGLLYALAVAMRQEMLVALLPLLLAGAGLGSSEKRRWRNAAMCALAAALPLLLLATQRELATGRFALTSKHAGLAVLGSYVPGAPPTPGRTPPLHRLRRPALLADHHRMRRAGRRPRARRGPAAAAFHAARIATAVLSQVLDGEATNLYWSVLIPGGLPEPLLPRGPALRRPAKPWLAIELAVLQALFLAALILALAWRNPAILMLVRGDRAQGRHPRRHRLPGAILPAGTALRDPGDRPGGRGGAAAAASAPPPRPPSPPSQPAPPPLLSSPWPSWLPGPPGGC